MRNFQAGTFKTHHHNKDFEYKSFIPNQINRDYDCRNNKIYNLLTRAERLLGQLNAYSTLIPDMDFFIVMLVRKEAIKSSRIEGTQTEIDEIILPIENIQPEKLADWEEVNNYIKAIDFSIDKLKDLPLCMRLLNSTHKILLTGVRGSSKQPGQIRKSQNWIGGPNIESATFIPPHHSDLPQLLSNLESFWHNTSFDIPELIKIAISHYQFETIHPYLDGNGRIGRLLITLQLVDYKILDRPTLYISDFFERNKGNYYDSLTLVRQNNELEQWILFFLSGVIETAKNSSLTFKKIIELRKKYESKIHQFGRLAENGGKLLLNMFSLPVITVKQASELLDVSYNAANRLLNLFLEKEMVNIWIGKHRERRFVLNEYLSLFY
jgi:Fic family protein